MIDIAVLLLVLAGFGFLLMAMPRHQQDWLKRKLSQAHAHSLRLSGLVMLAAAYGVSGRGLGWAYGTVAWFGWLTVAAAIVVTVNTNCGAIMENFRFRPSRKRDTSHHLGRKSC